jgi:hypothetical protein
LLRIDVAQRQHLAELMLRQRALAADRRSRAERDCAQSSREVAFRAMDFGDVGQTNNRGSTIDRRPEADFRRQRRLRQH